MLLLRQFKAQGSKAFAAKDFPRAIDLYTKVSIPPPPGQYYDKMLRGYRAG